MRPITFNMKSPGAPYGPADPMGGSFISKRTAAGDAAKAQLELLRSKYGPGWKPPTTSEMGLPLIPAAIAVAKFVVPKLGGPVTTTVSTGVKVVGTGAKVVTPAVTAVGRTGLGLISSVPGLKNILPKEISTKAVANVTKKEMLDTALTAGLTALGIQQVVDILPDRFKAIPGQILDTAEWLGDIGISQLPSLETGKSIDLRDTGGGSNVGHPKPGTQLQRRGPTALGLMPDANAIVRAWHANGVSFWRTLDGWIYVQRLDGTVKRYKPYKSVVLGKRPSSRQVNRAINKLKSEHKVYRKLNALFAPKRRS